MGWGSDCKNRKNHGKIVPLLFCFTIWQAEEGETQNTETADRL